MASLGTCGITKLAHSQLLLRVILVVSNAVLVEHAELNLSTITQKATPEFSLKQKKGNVVDFILSLVCRVVSLICVLMESDIIVSLLTVYASSTIIRPYRTSVAQHQRAAPMS